MLLIVVPNQRAFKKKSHTSIMAMVVRYHSRKADGRVPAIGFLEGNHSISLRSWYRKHIQVIKYRDTVLVDT